MKYFETATLGSIAALLAAMLLVTGCGDMLVEDVRSEVSTDFFETTQGFEEALNASYEALRSFYGKEMGATLTVFGTDTYQQGSDGSYKYFDRYGGELNPEAWYITNLWNEMYQGINTTNTVVERAETVEGLSDEAVNERLAEARFLRAHYYFILVHKYGPVHLTLEETEGVETEASRAPLEEVYQAIVDDLEFAIANLPIEPRQYGRATKPAAEHMLARVLLTRGWSDAAQSTDFERAADLADRVINDYGFELLDNYRDLWDMDNQQNDEVIWSVQYSQDPLVNAGGNNLHLYFLMEYDVLPGMHRNVRDGRPWKRFAPTDYTLETLYSHEYRNHDVRYDENFVDVFYTSNPGTYTIQGQEVTLALGDTAIYLPGAEMSEQEKSERPYLVIAPSDYTDRFYPTLIKHLDPRRADLNATDGSRDVFVARLAETHFIAAEAKLLGSGNSAEAAEHLNAVRFRSAKSDAGGDTGASEDFLRVEPGEVDIDLILDDRGRELLGEQQRWFDLVRTNTLVERVNAHNAYGSGNVQEFHQRRPIPQTQIDRMTNSEDFPQNDGYN